MKNAGEFDNQWDKLLHFLAGVKHSDRIGNWFGYELGFWNEKIDSIIRVYGSITGTRESHHVGFDWKDFAWTAAGSLFHELVADAPKNSQGINVIKAFSNGEISISDIFSAENISEGHGFFNQRITPFFRTNIDLINEELDKMERKIRALY